MQETRTVNVERVSDPVWRQFRAYCTYRGEPTGVLLSQAIERFMREVQKPLDGSERLTPQGMEDWEALQP